MNLIAKARENIEAEALIKTAERVLVSLSGGPDSTALLYILASLKNGFNCELSAVYLNHNLRPDYIDAEIGFCRKICGELDIPFKVESGDIPTMAEKMKLSIETAARQFRRETLEKLAEENDFDKIALGHHQDDAIETILFRLFRGTGPGGLFPIRPISGRYIRPFYNIPKREILDYLNTNGIGYMTDHTNEQSDYSRNYIRNEVIPVIEKEFGDKYRRALLNFTDIAHNQDIFVRSVALRELKEISTITPGKKIVVDLDRFASYDLPLKRVVAKILLENAAGVDGFGTFDEVESLIETAGEKRKERDLSGGLKAAYDRGKLILWKETTEIASRNIAIPSQTVIDELNAMLRVRLRDKIPNKIKAQKEGNRVFLDSEKISPPIILRGIANGDRFHPFGMEGTKKVGDLLTDRKISRILRDEIPILEDRKGVFWVIGIEIDERVKISVKTRKVLEIDFSAKYRRDERI